MAKYRKKPVIIDAEVYHPGLEDGFEKKCTITDYTSCVMCTYTFCDGKIITRPYINTLEGIHYITEGDYIITGIKGERYPCKPDIFLATYDKVE